MKVDKLNMEKLFIQPCRYEVPQFQRPYVWTRTKQWAPLWEDVASTAERWLANPHQAPPHFLGAIVLQQTFTSPRRLTTRLVVDGQQRLLTLQLLLDAVREVLDERGEHGAARRLEKLVRNDKDFCDGERDRMYKLWPAEDDRAPLQIAIPTQDDFPTASEADSPIVKAHNFFRHQCRQWLRDEGDADSETRCRAIEETVMYMMEMVVIDLEQGEDPHVIFETLNARGTPLLQSDLVKNFLLFESQQAKTPMTPSVLSMFQEKWWRREIRQGRIVRPRIDVFLNYWLIMRVHKNVLASDVFTQFREYCKNGTRSIGEIASDIEHIGDAYTVLEDNSRADIADFLYRWDVMQVGVVTPVLLWLLTNNIYDDQLVRAFRAIDSFLIRRMACNKATMGLNRLFISLVGKLDRSEAQDVGDTIVSYFDRQTSTVGMWPSNRDVRKAFLEIPLYDKLSRGRLRVLLEGIERALRTEKTETQDVLPKLTIEHIMPQKWQLHWPFPDGTEDQVRASEKRDGILHTIGNLTLVSGKLNPSMTNAPWEHKRKELGRHSVLFLNKELIENERWNEAEIEKRARSLCEAAIRMWPHANSI